jgi:primosomal protein N'
MLAKGLDFDNVSLVVNADNMLYHPDFRALKEVSK